MLALVKSQSGNLQDIHKSSCLHLYIISSEHGRACYDHIRACIKHGLHVFCLNTSVHFNTKLRIDITGMGAKRTDPVCRFRDILLPGILRL